MKYIVEADEHVQMISLIAVREGTAIMITGNVETFQTADKELDDAYQKGLEEGKKQAKVQAHLDVCHDIERVAHGNYQQGLNDAWECAKKIFGYEIDGGLPLDELRNVFGVKDVPFCTADIFRINTASEALAKIKAYEEQQKADGIKVGDEVCFVFAGGETIEPFIVFSIKDDNGKKYYEGIQTSDGRWVSGGLKYYKTGRHFPQIEELLKAMKGGAE